MDLNVTERSVDSQVVAEVRGEVDVHSAPQLRDELIRSLSQGAPALIVDLSALGFIDSTGLGALVAARNHATQNASDLVVVCPSERLLKLFRITGLDGVFRIYPTVPDAVADLAAGSIPSQP